MSMRCLRVKGGTLMMTIVKGSIADVGWWGRPAVNILISTTPTVPSRPAMPRVLIGASTLVVSSNAWEQRAADEALATIRKQPPSNGSPRKNLFLHSSSDITYQVLYEAHSLFFARREAQVHQRCAQSPHHPTVSALPRLSMNLIAITEDLPSEVLVLLIETLLLGKVMHPKDSRPQLGSVLL